MIPTRTPTLVIQLKTYHLGFKITPPEIPCVPNQTQTTSPFDLFNYERPFNLNICFGSDSLIGKATVFVRLKYNTRGTSTRRQTFKQARHPESADIQRVVTSLSICWESTSICLESESLKSGRSLWPSKYPLPNRS